MWNILFHYKVMAFKKRISSSQIILLLKYYENYDIELKKYLEFILHELNNVK